MTVTRRTMLTGAAALAAPAIARGQTATRLKFANIMPADHPLNTRMAEAAATIRTATGGRIDIAIFPSSQLGNDGDMLSQLRVGGIDFFAQSGLIVASLVPLAAISGVGFAFADYDQVWRAMDGPLGQAIIKAFEKANLVAFDRVWDNGFRQTTSSARPIATAADMAGFKIRVPPSPLWTSLFRDLGAAPTSIPWGETYSALQTHVADGLENPLAGIYFAKMYEVQKYLAQTNHMWDGFWFLANRRSFDRLSPDDRDLLVRTVNAAALAQREDVRKLNNSLADTLKQSGLQFVPTQSEQFRDVLRASTFYTDWRQKFGDDAWGLLEDATTRLH